MENSDGLRTFRQHFYGLKFITDEFPALNSGGSFPQSEKLLISCLLHEDQHIPALDPCTSLCQSGPDCTRNWHPIPSTELFKNRTPEVKGPQGPKTPRTIWSQRMLRCGDVAWAQTIHEDLGQTKRPPSTIPTIPSKSQRSHIPNFSPNIPSGYVKVAMENDHL